MASRPNPYRDSGPWGRVAIGGIVLPGVVLSIDGAERPEEWDVQKPTEKSGATTVWKGTNLANAIKIVLALHDEASVDRYYEVRDALRPKQGTRPPALPIDSPIINFAGITRVSCRNPAPPKWVAAGAYWTGTITVIDFSPPKEADTGVARPGGRGGRGEYHVEAVDPNADLKRERAALLAKARALASGGRNR